MSGDRKHVVIVGGGFAGLGCAERLSKHDEVDVTLIDRNNYHQFQPLLYQVATSQLAPSDIANSLRTVFANEDNVDVKLADIVEVDPVTRVVTARNGDTWTADALVLAAGAQPNFFGTSGAPENSFPLYSLDDATKLRSRVLGLLEYVDRRPELVDRGALNFVIVGGGPTGVEVAGAIADMMSITVPAEYNSIESGMPAVHLIDHGDALLRPFSDDAHDYVSKVLTEKGVQIHLGVGVDEVGTGHARLSDGAIVPTRCVVWGGGIKAAPLAAGCGTAQGRGGASMSTWTSRWPVTSTRTLSATWPTFPTRAARCRSWARSRCRAANGPLTTSSPNSPASPASRSPTTTRGSWR